MYGRKYFGVLRKTYIIDARGKIVRIFCESEAAGPRRRGAGVRSRAEPLRP